MGRLKQWQLLRISLEDQVSALAAFRVPLTAPTIPGEAQCRFGHQPSVSCRVEETRMEWYELDGNKEAWLRYLAAEDERLAREGLLRLLSEDGSVILKHIDELTPGDVAAI
jgi:hypothetical protein